jgi:hypothetical protein
MAVGMKIWDANAQLIVDVGDRIGRFIGTVTVPAGTTGSKIVSEFSQGTPFLISIAAGDGNPAYAYYSGTTLYWRYEPGGYATNVDTEIHYGVY